MSQTGPNKSSHIFQNLQRLRYTSGTTGEPKAVMLSHDNIISVCSSFISITALHMGFCSGPGPERLLSYLPLSPGSHGKTLHSGCFFASRWPEISLKLCIVRGAFCVGVQLFWTYRNLSFMMCPCSGRMPLDSWWIWFSPWWPRQLQVHHMYLSLANKKAYAMAVIVYSVIAVRLMVPQEDRTNAHKFSNAYRSWFYSSSCFMLTGTPCWFAHEGWPLSLCSAGKCHKKVDFGGACITIKGWKACIPMLPSYIGSFDLLEMVFSPRANISLCHCRWWPTLQGLTIWRWAVLKTLIWMGSASTSQGNLCRLEVWFRKSATV